MLDKRRLLLYIGYHAAPSFREVQVFRDVQGALAVTARTHAHFQYMTKIMTRGMNIRRKCIDTVVFRGLFVGHMHLFLLRFQPLRYRPSKCYCKYGEVFGNHRGCLFTNDCGSHKHWKHAWHSGTCARGASWYVSINVVRVSQLLHGQWVKTLVFNNYTNASFALGIFLFLWLVWNKGSALLVFTAQAWRDITILM